MTALLLACLASLKSWWCIDQPRIPPHQGRLLTLQPPSLLIVDHRRWQLEERSVGMDPQGPYVRYRCVDEEQASAELIVYPQNIGVRTIWISNQQSIDLTEEDIEVYPLPTRRADIHRERRVPEIDPYPTRPS